VFGLLQPQFHSRRGEVQINISAPHPEMLSLPANNNHGQKTFGTITRVDS